jgi:hypothetical protein
VKLLPQVRQWSPGSGRFLPPGAAPALWGPPADPPPWLTLERGPTELGSQSYRLDVHARGATLRAQDDAGEYYGRRTLEQLWRAHPEGLPVGRILDWPAFKVRGVSLDVSRGRVPKLATLMRFADRLARLKVNHLQLYMEQTFRFPSHPLIGTGEDPYSQDDLRRFDRYCAERHIELCPSFASLGHLSKVLGLPPYRHLAEDLGVRAYPKGVPDPDKLADFEAGWTLSPAKPEGLRFLEDLYRDLLPCFGTRRFNACCDEPFDLGWGQSRDLVLAEGLGAVFARHVEAARSLAAALGKPSVMVWGDLLRAQPSSLARLDRSLVILDWLYDENADFGGIGRFIGAGFEAWACPSTNSWGTLFPRLPMAGANIRAFSAAAAAAGAGGLLNTVWGDGDHFNLPQNEWHGLALGAEMGWNPDADAPNFTRRFCAVCLGREDETFAGAMDALGDAATLMQHGGRSSFWSQALLDGPGAAVFGNGQKAFYRAEGGRIVRDDRSIDRDLVAAARESFLRAGTVLQSGAGDSDPLAVGPALDHSVRALVLAADRILWMWTARRPGREGLALDERLAALGRSLAALWTKDDGGSGLARLQARFQKARLTGA